MFILNFLINFTFLRMFVRKVLSQKRYVCPFFYKYFHLSIQISYIETEIFVTGLSGANITDWSYRCKQNY